MFERFTGTSRKPRSRLAVLLSLSISAHVAVVMTLLIVGFWQIEKLMPPERRVSLMPTGGALAATAPKPAPMERMKKPEVVKRPVKDLVQPEKPRPDEETQPLVEYDGSGPVSEDGGGPVGIGTGDGDFQIGGPTGPAIPVVTTPPIVPRLEPPPAPKVRNIPSHKLDGKRIAGEAYIMPPGSVRMTMQRHDERLLRGVIGMCLDRRGMVTRLEVGRSTGYPTYDKKLLDAMKRWRYEPFSVDGEPVPVCTRIEYIYKVID